MFIRDCFVRVFTHSVVGRERRELVSQLAWCGGGCFDSGRRVNSTVGRLSLGHQGKIKMFRSANLLMLSLTLFCSAPTAYTEDVSTVVEEVKAVVKEKASCWKLYHQQERKDGVRPSR